MVTAAIAPATRSAASVATYMETGLVATTGGATGAGIASGGGARTGGRDSAGVCCAGGTVTASGEGVAVV